jgi:phosphate transport system substrate-binding protein
MNVQSEVVLMRRLLFGAALSAAAVGSAYAQAVRVDPSIPAYSRSSGVSGNINSVGSDTMNNLMALWGEGFQKLYANVKIQIEGKGSTTAPPALIAGTSQFGPMSRAMKPTEIDQFEKKYGYKPTQIRTSYDALAVWVNKDNPIDKLTLAQVDAIFSKARKRGYKADVKTWGQLGLTGDWAHRPISLYGRNSASGTYGFFKEHAMLNGDYKDTVKEQPGSASVVQGVTEDRFGIGYSGIGYKTSGVKPVQLAEKDVYFDGGYGNVTSGKYPLWRFLYLYVNKAPGKPLDPLVKEFVKLILSKEGQEVVVKDGYLPLSPAIVKEELARLE